MNRILLLTKNVMVEMSLQEKVQKLGNEIFCSSELLGLFLRHQGYKYLELFQLVIISETVSDMELKLLLQSMPFEKKNIYRLESGELSEKEMGNWRALGLSHFLCYQASLKEMREKLVIEKTNFGFDISGDNEDDCLEESCSPEDFQRFLESLSEQERKFLSLLYLAKGSLVTRVELTKNLWGTEVSSSSLSQLSQIVRRIKTKMKASRVDYSLLETHWGRGYALSQEFFKSFDSQLKGTITKNMIYSFSNEVGKI